MNSFWEKVERVNRRLIPYALLVLLVLILAELFLEVENTAAERAVRFADYVVIAIFVVDLIFLALRAKNTRFFFANYWLDLIAVFPFSLFFRLLSELFRGIEFLERAVVGQYIFHESLEVEKIVARETRLMKYVRIAARVIRAATKSRLFVKLDMTKITPKETPSKTKRRKRLQRKNGNTSLF